MTLRPTRPASARRLRRSSERAARRVGAVVAGAALLGTAGTGAALASTSPSTSSATASTGSASTYQTSNSGTAVGFSPDPSGGGWTVTATGAVGTFGGAPSYGSASNVSLTKPIVGMASTLDGRGYWLVGSDGGIFSFGDARFYGSTGNLRLSSPVVGMASTPDGRGYWLVAADGGIFSFGDARFYGSTGNLRLSAPVVGMAAVPNGAGYYLVASDGGIFSFGTTRFYGSMGGKTITGTVTGMGINPAGGYWMVGSSGSTYAFNTPYLGSPAGQALVGVAGTGKSSSYEVASAAGTIYAYSAASAGSTTTTSAPSTTIPTTTSTTAAPTTTAPTSAGLLYPLTVDITGSSQFPVGLFEGTVTAQPVAANSSTMVSNLVQQYTTYYGAVGVNGMPVFTVGANQPLVHVAVRSGCNDFSAVVNNVPIPVGAYTTDPNYQNDSAIVIAQPSTHTEWEIWQAAKASDGSWSACWGGKINTTTSTGVFPWPSGLSASGISYLATMITQADVEAGSINHAVAMDVVRCNGDVAPANRGDCGSDAGQPPEGTWFRMPASVAMPSGLTPFGQMVFRALQQYGAVVTDQAGAVTLQAESAADWAAAGRTGTDPITASWAGHPEYTALAGMPWSALQVITPPGS